MERWRARNPWRGLSFRERRRLEHLSRSEQRIEDPQDGVRVRAYIEQMERLYRSRWWRFAFVYMPWLVVPTGLAGVVVRAIQGNLLHAVWDAAVVAAYAFLLFKFRKMRRQMERTAGANGWAEGVS
jgi:predicted alpha/beta-fold hydrolase